ncbi:hypothetical protein DXG01_011029 [Tephrocybe rancida]|nr:hypothetical protein DXG01_011029 [Tephrocybe rancida]
MPVTRSESKTTRGKTPYDGPSVVKKDGRSKVNQGGILGRLLEVNYDLFERTLFQMNLLELNSISEAHPKLRRLIRQHLQRSVYRMFTGLGFDPVHALEVLAESNSVVSGSSALLVLNPYTFIPRDLDVYCPRSQLDSVVASFLRKYPHFKRSLSPTEYDNIGHILSTVSLRDEERAINIIAARTENNLLPIFNFHSSVVMNYVSAWEIYSAYPDPTFTYRNIINRLAACMPGANSAKFAGCIAKYDERGYAYCADPTEWAGYQDKYFAQPSTERQLRDDGHFSLFWREESGLSGLMDEIWGTSSWKLAKSRLILS